MNRANSKTMKKYKKNNANKNKSESTEVYDIKNYWDQCFFSKYDPFIIHYNDKRWKCIGESHFFHGRKRLVSPLHTPMLLQFMELDKDEYETIYLDETELNHITLAVSSNTLSNNRKKKLKKENK